ncbi:FCD domain-containing protein [Glutamicibacter nicotianae]|nr:FCD domain-containing protein [Glutamicibacter nicotianae]MBM7769753.1 DNA-binding FadR family transcriptional regulator [Glutamicibacter nicotianae]
MSQSDELAEHRAIFDAIQNSDPAAATAAMALHLESIRTAMLGQH